MLCPTSVILHQDSYSRFRDPHRSFHVLSIVVLLKYMPQPCQLALEHIRLRLLIPRSHLSIYARVQLYDYDCTDHIKHTKKVLNEY